MDQVAVMTHDTALPVDWLHGPFVQRQVRLIAAASGDATVLVGVPSYEEPNLGHHPRAENVQVGVRAVRKGIGHLPPDRRDGVGIALYAEWTTDESEWADLRQSWRP